jgi:hypothetical protein
VKPTRNGTVEMTRHLRPAGERAMDTGNTLIRIPATPARTVGHVDPSAPLVRHEGGNEPDDG